MSMDNYVYRSRTSSNSSKRPRDESPDDWQQPKRPATPKGTYGRPGVPTSNSYSRLPVDQVTQLPEPLRNAVTRRKNPGRVPPIVIAIQDDWTHAKIKDTIEKYDKKFHLQYKGRNRVAVQCYSPEAHQTVKEGLQAEKIPYHTFTRKDEKMYKVVIRGLPEYFEDTLAEELSIIGFKEAKITKLVSPMRQASPCPPFLVQLPAGTDISKFRQIKYIGNCVVEIRRFKSNSTAGTQCFRCQHFGHTSRNCNLPPRCVKCTELHPTKDCPKKDRVVPARCCNCQEEHPANFFKCTERQKYLNRLKGNQAVDPKPSINVPTPRRPALTAPLKSWANATKNAHPQENPSGSTNLTHDSTTKEMLDILITVRNLKSQFVECKSMLDKVVLILTHLDQYI